VKITSPTNNQNISTGQLTIAGTSTETAASECQVYVDWNDKKPFQRVVATGSEGSGDYSRWNYTYTATYHEITNGTNELTSKISCLASPSNLTKWYSINVTGIEGLSSWANDPSGSESQEDRISSNNLNNISHPIPAISTTEITIPGHGPYRDLEGSESRSDDDNKDDDESDEGEEENEEKIGGSDFEYIEDNQDNDEENNGETELSSINENNLEEDEDDSTSGDDLEESDQNEDESQGPLYEDKDSIDSILEVIRDRDNHEDDDRTENEDSGIDPFIDIPFEVSIPRLSSIPSLPTPDLDDLEHVKGDDYNCDIVDAGFPFCDVREDK
jgi:hypothetical protein